MSNCLLTKSEKQKIFIDTNNIISSSISSGWVAPEDCIAIISRAGVLYLDNNILSYDNSGYYYSSAFYIKKGQKITTSGTGIYSSKSIAYGLKS